MRVVAGAAQQQAAAEHEPARRMRRGGVCAGEAGAPVRGVRACERAQRVGACAIAGRARAPAQQMGEGSWCWRMCEGMRGGVVTDAGPTKIGECACGGVCSIIMTNCGNRDGG